MINKVKCKHYDEENGWCKKLSDWSDPMPHIVYCPKSPCEHAEPIEQVASDNDIIKALEHCVSIAWIDECEGCPLCENSKCITAAERGALDLINRQKVEIERLNHIRAELSEEIDKLREVNNDFNYQVNACNPTQTIKDFAAYLCDGRVSNDPVVIAVKCAVKEMTEEKK